MKIPNFYIEDMLEAISLVQQYLKNCTEEEFSRDKETQDAVIYRLMIIGEAATKIPEEIKKQATDIPWRTIIGFRNVVIHNYAHVSMGRVWEICQTELPKLTKQLSNLLQRLPQVPKL